MKRLSAMSGVTLLEIMLVLAIAAMVIVMSIRYYTSANVSQQTNVVMGQIQAITAAMDNLAMGTNSYSGIQSTAVSSVVGANNMKTPWGDTIGISAQGATTYKVTIPKAPTGVCNSVAAKLKSFPRYTSPNCNTNGTITYTYDASKF